MPIAVIMPKFEMTQETGTVGSWLKAEGDFVRKGEPILEIETDKVSMEVELPADGTLVGISAGHGQVVPVGQPIAYLVREGETWPTQASEPAQPAAQPGPELKAEVPPKHTVAVSPIAARMATELGIDLSAVTGTGSHGQVTRKDIESYLGNTGTSATERPRDTTSASNGHFHVLMKATRTYAPCQPPAGWHASWE